MECSVRGEGGEEGGYPFDSCLPSSGNGANKNSSKKFSHTHNELPGHNPLLTLYVKFDLPIYDRELNAKKLDNWVKQIEIYCSV